MKTIKAKDLLKCYSMNEDIHGSDLNMDLITHSAVICEVSKQYGSIKEGLKNGMFLLRNDYEFKDLIQLKHYIENNNNKSCYILKIIY